MTLRNVPNSFTLEQQRQEVNLIAVDLDSAVTGTQTFSGNKTFSNDVTFEAQVLLGDGDQILFGDDSDLKIYYDGSVGVETSFIDSDALQIRSATDTSELYATFLKDGPVELYYDGTKRFGTSATGASVLGNFTVSGASEFSGATNLISGSNTLNFNTNTNQEGQLYATSEYFYINSSATLGMFIQSDSIAIRSATGGENYFTASINNGAFLYYDNVEKFSTNQFGVSVTGNLSLGTNPSSNPTIFLNNDGAATFESTVTADGNSTTNNRFVVRTLNDEKFTVIGDGTVDIGGTPGTAPNTRLNADGSASFTETVSIGSGSAAPDDYGLIAYADADSLSNKAAVYARNLNAGGRTFTGDNETGTTTFEVYADGSATFAGSIDATGFTISGSPIQTAVATTSSVGTVQPDGTTISIDGSGVISVAGGGDPFTADGFKFGVNESSGPAATQGEIRQISGKPHFYDGSAWQEFILGSTQVTTIPAETSWDKVLLRATFDSDFNDVKYSAVGNPNTYTTFAGNPVSPSTLVAAPAKFGANVLKNVGNGVIYPNRAEYDFTGEFTLECWVNFDSTLATYSTSNTNKHIIFGKSDSSFSNGSWRFYIQTRSNGQIGFFLDIHDTATNTASTLWLDNITSLSSWEDQYLNTWSHIALVKESDGSIHLYRDGVDAFFTYDSQLFANNITNTTHALAIGTAQDASYVPGYNDMFIDDLRITKDARYTTNGSYETQSFVPPTTAHPVSGTTTTYTPPATSKAGEITLGATPTWTGSTGVTVTQQSSGNYRMTFTNPFNTATDYYVFTNHMDYIGGQVVFVKTTRSSSHIDFLVYREGDGNLIDTGSIAVQVIAH